MTAACTGSTIAFVNAVPNDGYRATTENEGPQVVEVYFSNKKNNKVLVIESDCVDGTPVKIPPNGWGVGSGSNPNPGQF